MNAPVERRSLLLFGVVAVIAVGVLVAVALFRDLPARIANGDHGRVAIQTLDEVRRPFLAIQDSVSGLMNEGYNPGLGEDFQRGVARGQDLVALFKEVGAYNPEVLRRVELLAESFDAWVEDERALFGLAERGEGGEAEAQQRLMAVASQGFSRTMALLGDAEGPIHDDIDRGSEAVAELTLIGGILIAGLTALAFFLMWSRTRTLRTMLTLREQTEAQIMQLNETLEQRVEERTADLRSVQAELMRKERLATLGQLTGIVAHEIRNPLGTITASLGVIGMKSRDTGLDIEKTIDRANRGVARCDDIVTKLLDYGRSKGIQPEPTGLDVWLSEMLDEYELPEGISLVRDCTLGEVLVQVDPDDLRRAVTNLLDNACQAMTSASGDEGNAEVGRLTVVTRRKGDRIEIEVGDTGPGIAEEMKSRIFEPLFSTKSFGVGLGLSIVQKVAQEHGGGLEISSDEGKGTRAILWLPAQAAA